MPDIKETAETIINSGKALGKGMSFIERFWLKKNGPGITIFVVVLLGFVTAIFFYNNGIEDGKESAISEVNSLKKSSIYDSMQIRRLQKNNGQLERELDSCNNSSMNGNLEALVTKKLEEAERIKRILERKIVSDQKDVKILDKIIKN